MSVAVTSILDEVETRLGNITETNGYNVTVKRVDRGKLTPFKSHDLPAINFWPTGISNDRDYGRDNRSITLYIEIHGKTRDEAFSTVAEKLAADVVTALSRSDKNPKVSDDPSFNLGDTVSDVIFNGYDYEIGEGQKPWCGALLSFTIKFSTSIFNMTTYSA
jgi:hypothetical protein